jgi:hypothetical protein
MESLPGFQTFIVLFEAQNRLMRLHLASLAIHES